jgi:hypothetical protein
MNMSDPEPPVAFRMLLTAPSIPVAAPPKRFTITSVVQAE